jgi:hypothetical protein
MLSFHGLVGSCQVSTLRTISCSVPRSVYRVRQVLIGFPTWSPRMHARVAIVHSKRQEKTPKNGEGVDCSGAATSQDGQHQPEDGGVATLLDLIPERPTELGFLVGIALGQEQTGVIRSKRIRWPPVERAGLSYWFVGMSRRADSEITAFLEQCPPRISRENNCGKFEQQCLEFLFSDADEAQDGSTAI